MLQPKQFGAGQLPLFMSGRELRAIPSGDGPREESDAVYDQKLREAKQTGLHDSIGREGVRDPVGVDLDADPEWQSVRQGGVAEPNIHSGNHRVASAAEHDKEFVPVLFHETTGDSFYNYEKWQQMDRAYPAIDGTGEGDLAPERRPF
jgi:hypothetical protein